VLVARVFFFPFCSSTKGSHIYVLFFSDFQQLDILLMTKLCVDG